MNPPTSTGTFSLAGARDPLAERALRGLLRGIAKWRSPPVSGAPRCTAPWSKSRCAFLIEEVGQVEGVYPSEGNLAENFILKRTASHGIELLGILAFHASPVGCWPRLPMPPAAAHTDRRNLR